LEDVKLATTNKAKFRKQKQFKKKLKFKVAKAGIEKVDQPKMTFLPSVTVTRQIIDALH
jgi:hypothetical protein